MADLNKIIDELSTLTVVEAAASTTVSVDSSSIILFKSAIVFPMN